MVSLQSSGVDRDSLVSRSGASWVPLAEARVYCRQVDQLKSCRRYVQAAIRAIDCYQDTGEQLVSCRSAAPIVADLTNREFHPVIIGGKCDHRLGAFFFHHVLVNDLSPCRASFSRGTSHNLCGHSL